MRIFLTVNEKIIEKSTEKPCKTVQFKVGMKIALYTGEGVNYILIIQEGKHENKSSSNQTAQ